MGLVYGVHPRQVLAHENEWLQADPGPYSYWNLLHFIVDRGWSADYLYRLRDKYSVYFGDPVPYEITPDQRTWKTLLHLAVESELAESIALMRALLDQSLEFEDDGKLYLLFRWLTTFTIDIDNDLDHSDTLRLIYSKILGNVLRAAKSWHPNDNMLLSKIQLLFDCDKGGHLDILGTVQIEYILESVQAKAVMEGKFERPLETLELPIPGQRLNLIQVAQHYALPNGLIQTLQNTCNLVHACARNVPARVLSILCQEANILDVRGVTLPVDGAEIGEGTTIFDYFTTEFDYPTNDPTTVFDYLMNHREDNDIRLHDARFYLAAQHNLQYSDFSWVVGFFQNHAEEIAANNRA